MLRNKNYAYKRKRQEISDMTAELQLLKRTEELLRHEVDQLKSQMVTKREIDFSETRSQIIFLSNLEHRRT